ncbi:MAG: diguanylate cyclase [Gallionellaceae bacterium]
MSPHITIENKLRAIIDAAPDAVITTNESGVIMSWNPQATRVFGWTEAEAIGRAIESMIIPPRYREAHAKGLGRYLETGVGHHIDRTIEIQAVDCSAREFPIELTIVPIKADGTTEFCAFIRDITHRKRIEDVQAARIRLMEYASDHTLRELLIETLDEAGKLTDSPIGFYHFLEADQKTLALQAWSSRTTREFCTASADPGHYNIDEAGVWVECIRERMALIHNDYATLPNKKGLPAGHAQVLREMVVPVFRNNLIVSILGVGNKAVPYHQDDLETIALLADLAWDLAENKRLEAELVELATTDFLTGLANRRHFMSIAEAELSRLQRDESRLASILMLDIDHFKNLNDTFGHAVGDLALMNFAKEVKGALRRIDTAGRIGGEEFAVLLPDTDAVEAEVLAERIRQKISNSAFVQDGKKVSITVSIGISTLTAKDETPESALNRADKALYQAKGSGRNRVELVLE